jgi:hypothetical protein
LPTGFAIENFAPQFSDGCRLSLTLFRPVQRSQQAAGVCRCSQKMCGFHQSRKFTSRYESNIPQTAAPHNDRFLLVDNLIQDACQILPQARVSGFSCHLYLLYSNPVRYELAPRAELCHFQGGASIGGGRGFVLGGRRNDADLADYP